jgi:hypothetical protein
MALFAGSLLPWIECRFLSADGAPLAGGFLYSYVAGSSTPLPLYSDVDLTVEHTNPVELDANGRPPGGVIYVARAGYKFVLTDSDYVQQYVVDNVEDVGATFAGNFGLVLAEGASDVVSGYEVLNTDRLVTVDSTGGADPCVITMISAALSQQLVTIKNMGTVEIALTPHGSETIDGVAGVYTIPAAASPVFPSVMMVPDGVSNWTIIGSHGLT